MILDTNEEQKAVEYLSSEFNVSEATALVALDHALESVVQARALLSSETAIQLFNREVREYGLES